MEIERVEGTKFTLVRKKGGEKWSITIGREIVSFKEFKKTKAAIKYINEKPWELIEMVSLVYARNLSAWERREEQRINQQK